MTDWASNMVMSLSTASFRLILQAYPYEFRCEFSESMIQVFRDSVRDAWQESGFMGFIVLWLRTLGDIVVSLFTAYTNEKRGPMFNLIVGLSILYMTALCATVGYGAVKFGEFYAPPAFSLFGAPGAHEDVLLAAYAQAMRGEFGGYRAFIVAAGFSLAVLLGAACGLFGLWQRNFLHGFAALIGGTALTIGALHLLPTVWFPLDRYPASALWLMGGGVPLALCTCLLINLLGRFGRPRAFFSLETRNQ